MIFNTCFLNATWLLLLKYENIPLMKNKVFVLTLGLLTRSFLCSPDPSCRLVSQHQRQHPCKWDKGPEADFLQVREEDLPLTCCDSDAHTWQRWQFHAVTPLKHLLFTNLDEASSGILIICIKTVNQKESYSSSLNSGHCWASGSRDGPNAFLTCGIRTFLIFSGFPSFLFLFFFFWVF